MNPLKDLLQRSASEAITARRLKLALRHWSQPSPAIISVTSVGDTDTSTWWSLGMNAALLTKSRSYRRYNDGSHQKEYVVKTAGHSPIMLDRQISRLEPQPPPPDEDAAKSLRIWRWRFRLLCRSVLRSGASTSRSARSPMLICLALGAALFAIKAIGKACGFGFFIGV